MPKESTFAMATQLPEDLRIRCVQLSDAAKAVDRAIGRLRADLDRAGLRFPGAIDTALSHMQLSADQLFLLTKPSSVEPNGSDQQ